LSVALPVCAADLLDQLGLKKTTGSVAGLSNDQMISGLKEALAKGVQYAQVKIPLPGSLNKVERTLRTVGQDHLADEFITTMNRAAEQAVPEAASVLGDTVKQMTLADAKAILTSTNTAATDYFRRTSTTNLHARFLPIVKQATEKVGVTAAYKRMTDKAGLGGFGASLLGKESLDLDDYVTRKALDGLFLKIAEQEKLIRENPAARTSELLQKVFGAVKK
jgi:hypothetical protein